MGMHYNRCCLAETAISWPKMLRRLWVQTLSKLLRSDLLSQAGLSICKYLIVSACN